MIGKPVVRGCAFGLHFLDGRLPTLIDRLGGGVDAFVNLLGRHGLMEGRVDIGMGAGVNPGIGAWSTLLCGEFVNWGSHATGRLRRSNLGEG